LPVLAILGDPGLVGDGNFTLTQTGDGVRAEKVLPDGLVLTKEISYQLELPRQCDREPEKQFRQAARPARAAMGHPHGHADGTGRTTGCISARCGITARNTPTDCALSYFQHQHDDFLHLFPDAKNSF